jgi:hypothetical protein
MGNILVEASVKEDGDWIVVHEGQEGKHARREKRRRQCRNEHASQGLRIGAAERAGRIDQGEVEE